MAFCLSGSSHWPSPNDCCPRITRTRSAAGRVEAMLGSAPLFGVGEAIGGLTCEETMRAEHARGVGSVLSLEGYDRSQFVVRRSLSRAMGRCWLHVSVRQLEMRGVRSTHAGPVDPGSGSLAGGFDALYLDFTLFPSLFDTNSRLSGHGYPSRAFTLFPNAIYSHYHVKQDADGESSKGSKKQTRQETS